MSAGAIGGASNQGIEGFNGFGQLSSEEFIKVLTEELTHQDPFQPQDSGALLEQLSSLRNIESQMMLQDQIGALVLQNQMTAAGNMIGKLVVGMDDQNMSISGVVESVRVVDEKVMVGLDNGKQLAMDRIMEVDDLSQIESLVLENQVSTASQLIGRVVRGFNELGAEASGLVMSVTVENGKPVLELDSGHKLGIDRLTRVSAAN